MTTPNRESNNLSHFHTDPQVVITRLSTLIAHLEETIKGYDFGKFSELSQVLLTSLKQILVLRTENEATEIADNIAIHLMTASDILVQPAKLKATISKIRTRLSHSERELVRASSEFETLKKELKDAEYDLKQNETTQDDVNAVKRGIYSIQVYCTKLSELNHALKSRLEKLEAYSRAIEIVLTGITDSLLTDVEALPVFEMLELPADERDIQIQRKTTGRAEKTQRKGKVPTTNPAKPKAEIPPVHRNETWRKIKALGEKHNLTPNEVIILTLFHSIPPAGKGSRKSLISVVNSAYISGIMAKFNYKVIAHCLEGWRGFKIETPIGTYLRYVGSFGNTHMYVKSDVRLPWNVYEVFDAFEIAEFNEALRRAKKAYKEGKK